MAASAILEIPEVRRRVSPLSVEEYHQLGEFNENARRTELFRGIVQLEPGFGRKGHFDLREPSHSYFDLKRFIPTLGH